MGYVARYGYITGKLYEYSFSLYLLCDNDFFLIKMIRSLLTLLIIKIITFVWYDMIFADLLR